MKEDIGNTREEEQLDDARHDELKEKGVALALLVRCQRQT